MKPNLDPSYLTLNGIPESILWRKLVLKKKTSKDNEKHAKITVKKNLIHEYIWPQGYKTFFMLNSTEHKK